jgi:hypothetical protein
MTIYPARADRYAIAGFALGVLCVLALPAAYSFAIRGWPPGLDNAGAILYVSTFPASLLGTLLSGWGRFSHARRGLAVAGFVLSLGAALTVLGFFILAIIMLSQSHFT